MTNIYNKVLEMVRSHMTIDQALQKIGESRSKFYKSISMDQKAELKLAKMMNAKSPKPTMKLEGHSVEYLEMINEHNVPVFSRY